jgi:hypothetical protein
MVFDGAMWVEKKIGSHSEDLAGWRSIKYEPLRGEGTTALDSCCESHRAEQYCIFHCQSD